MTCPLFCRRGLDKTGGGAYDTPIMDSAIDRQKPAVVLSSLLWNWRAVPTAR